MRLSRLRTIFCLLLCLAIAIGAGFFFRGKFPHVSQDELEDSHETYLSPIGAILSSRKIRERIQILLQTERSF